MPQNDQLIPYILPLVVLLIVGAVWWVLRDFNKMNKKERDNWTNLN